MNAEQLIDAYLEGDADKPKIFDEIELFMRLASRYGKLSEETGDDDAGWWLGLYKSDNPEKIKELALSKIKSGRVSFENSKQGVDVYVEWDTPGKPKPGKKKPKRRKRRKGPGISYSVYD